MRNITLILLFSTLLTPILSAQPGFCGEPYSTFFSSNIFIPATLSPTLDNGPLPFGSHIIAVFKNNGRLRCGGNIQWSGLGASMVVNGADGTLPGFLPNEPYKYLVQLPNGCLIDSVAVTYELTGIYLNGGVFIDGSYAKLATFHAVSRQWLSLDPTNGLCELNSANIAASTSELGAPNSYIWNTGDTTSAIASLPNGQYTVTVTTAFGCTATAQANVVNVPALDIALNTGYQFSSISCESVASVSGGTPPLAYAWSNGQSGPTASGLTGGIFTVTVTDANGCSSTQTDNCIISSAYELSGLTTLQFGPNPAGDYLDFLAIFDDAASGAVTLLNAVGQVKYSSRFFSQEWKCHINLTHLPAGVYWVKISTGEKQMVEKIVVEK